MPKIEKMESLNSGRANKQYNNRSINQPTAARSIVRKEASARNKAAAARSNARQETSAWGMVAGRRGGRYKKRKEKSAISRRRCPCSSRWTGGLATQHNTRQHQVPVARGIALKEPSARNTRLQQHAATLGRGGSAAIFRPNGGVESMVGVDESRVLQQHKGGK